MEGTLPDYDRTNCEIDFEDLPDRWVAQDVLEHQTYYRNGKYEVVIGFVNDGTAYAELAIITPNDVTFVTNRYFGTNEGNRAVAYGLGLMDAISHQEDL